LLLNGFWFSLLLGNPLLLSKNGSEKLLKLVPNSFLLNELLYGLLLLNPPKKGFPFKRLEVMCWNTLSNSSISLSSS
jgi:hypothetical protein